MQVLISPTTIDDVYEQEQAAVAEAAARRLGNCQNRHADNGASNKDSNCNINVASVTS